MIQGFQLKIRKQAKAIAAGVLALAMTMSSVGVITSYAYYANHVITGGTGMAAPLAGDDTASPATEGYAYQGTGTYADPYLIAVKGSKVSAETPYTRPSAFWGVWAGGSGSTSEVKHFKVIFENRGDALDGKLESSMAFDLIDHNSLLDGQSTQYVTDPANIWDGSWTYAFRLAPWTEFDTSTDSLRLAFSWKGKFAFYWKDWQFKFNVVDETKDLPADQQIEPGDRISLTYYGGYVSTETNRGSNYTVNFDTTDSNADSTLIADVDQNGYAVFEGANMISYGGNYRVTKIDIPIESIAVSAAGDATSITQNMGSLQMSASLTPSNTTQKNYTWDIVSGGELAAIDQNGLLTAKGTGNGIVTVRAASEDNPSVYKDFSVIISNNASLYKLSFSANGGSGLNESAMTVAYGSKLGILPTCYRKGYVFGGWYTAASGGSKISSATVCTKAASYYAHWNKVSVSRASISSLVSGSKKFTVKYKAVSGATGYLVRYSLRLNMSSANSVAVTGTQKTMQKLKSGKKYYVQVRAYKIDSSKSKVYGSWSTVKSVKVK